MQDVAAIVVTYNSESHIGDCLDALRHCGEIVVVDNASVDETVAIVSRRGRAQLIANSTNLGFAAAVNQGARAAASRYLLILNPDAVLASGCDSLIEACERSGIAAGCLVGGDGKPQSGFAIRSLPGPAALIFECLALNRLWPRNPVNRRYRCLDLDLSKACQVEQPAGAFLMVRRDVFTELGGFDERFWPVWYEDVDFCRRARDAGYVIEYSPDAQARHSGAHSVQKLETRFQHLYWYGSLLRYVEKHYRPSTFRTVCCAVVLGSLLRSMEMRFRRRDSRPRDYIQVLRLAVASFLAGRLVRPPADHEKDGRASSRRQPMRQVVDQKKNAHSHGI
jgi:N-acetylglucosaminyl-diphospho-decaprenol L-rhamnosyltransferase